MNKIFDEIAAERKRQNKKWGEQNHPITLDTVEAWERSLAAIRHCNETRPLAWDNILVEKICEAFVETDIKRQREEMVQVAAVCIQIIEYLDRLTINRTGSII